MFFVKSCRITFSSLKNFKTNIFNNLYVAFCFNPKVTR